MSTEIEAKLKVDSHEQVAAALTQLGADYEGVLEQTDCYFDDEVGSLAGADKCLRIRTQKADENTQLLLTYKGPKAADQYKQRQEVEFEVSDGPSARQLLLSLGYREALVVRKTRRVWRFGGCEVLLDELDGLGLFVEIEGRSNSDIEKVQGQLGLSQLEHIQDSYADLLQRTQGLGQ